MTKYDIYEIAADNYGLITRKQAFENGISDKELSRIASDGRLERLGYGVYRVKHHVIGKLDPYAESVALVGQDAYLYGESVLAMLSLCPTNPTKMTVATPKRVRRNLPKGMKVVRRVNATDVTTYEGIPAQRVSAAIVSCIGKMMPQRLKEAADEALRQGFISKRESITLIKEIDSQ